MRRIAVAVALALGAAPAAAQFVGPGLTGSSVAAASAAPWGTYVTLTGQIVAHIGEDYYTFRDASGSIRVEIEPEVWQGRPVTPLTQVQITGEVDGIPGLPDTRYIWVEALRILP